MKFHHNTKSLWKDLGPVLNFPKLTGTRSEDIVVIGGGITGLTLALSLQQQGRAVTLLESEHIGNGTTGRTSAHITQMLDHRYINFERELGGDKGTLFASSIRSSMNKIIELASLCEISCDLTEVDGFLYTEEPTKEDFLHRECQAANNLGVALEFNSKVPGLPFETFGAVRFPKQYHFHPMRYIEGIARAFIQKGGQIYERTHVDEVKDGKPCTVHADSGTITANEVVMATHTPLGFNLVQTELCPTMSYVLTAQISKPVPEALFWDTFEPYYYTRPIHLLDNRPRILVGGEDHHTGRHNDTDSCFENLENYVRRRYDVVEVEHRWSAQFFTSVDGLPFIGKSPRAHHIFIATGFASEGLTFGTLAALLLSDEIQGKVTELHRLFSPSRIAALHAPRDFLSENLTNARKFFVDRLKGAEADEIGEVPVGEGKIVSVDGHKVAIYRDREGHVHSMSPVCTHLGCIVGWNASEKTWDCPCHGGRFHCSGEVLEGPPLKALDAVTLPEPITPDRIRVPPDGDRDRTLSKAPRVDLGMPLQPT